jgi:hypothetical protein
MFNSSSMEPCFWKCRSLRPGNAATSFSSIAAFVFAFIWIYLATDLAAHATLTTSSRSRFSRQSNRDARNWEIVAEPRAGDELGPYKLVKYLIAEAMLGSGPRIEIAAKKWLSRFL